MKTTRFISALLVPALFAACSDDMLDNQNIGNVPVENLVEGLTINVGLDKGGDATTRGTFAGSDEKGIFDKFYFEPDFSGSSDALVKTDNASIKGDQVGICLPNPVVGQGNVLTNVPFYIAGYQAALGTDGTENDPYSLVTDDNFYQIAENQQNNAAFESGATTTTKTNFDAAVAALKAGTEVTAGDADVSKAIFKSVSGVMTGDYVLYYPYNAEFTDMAKIPAVELSTIQAQGTFAASATATNDHVLGENLFAYSKVPFRVDGKQNAALNMNMTPAAYFFQFKLYTTGSSAVSLSAGKGIKLITVSTKDNAKAFAIKGNVSAGATNSFIADAETAVDMIGVETGDGEGATEIPVVTTATKNANALTAYLSTYAVPANLTGKDIVVKVYTKDGKVATFTKTAAGSAIKEGGTDYWNLDFNGVEFEEAEQFVYSEGTLEEALQNGGTVVLKTNITASKALTIAKETTINGEGYTITANGGLTISKNATVNCDVVIPAAKTLTVNANATINKVTNNGTVTLKENATKAGDGVVATITTLENNGTVTVNNYDVLKATTLNNNAVATTPATVSVLAKGSLDATLNNAAEVAAAGTVTKKEAGEVSIAGTAEGTINNEGTLTSTAETLPATLTINNKGSFDINEACSLNATLVNEGKVTIAASKVVNAYGAITNKGEIVNNGTFTLLGSCSLSNEGTISDLGVFSGLSRLTNVEGKDAHVIRTVEGEANFMPAVKESKITDIRIKGDVASATVINTTKTIYLSANLTLPLDNKSTLGKVVFEVANKTLIGNLSTTGIDVKVNGTIGAKSNVTVGGNITVEENVTLTGVPDSYTICDDIRGKGKVSGPIYVK